jgi:competence protein ComEC
LVVLPESAIDPGFQMSFLATAALVALWEIWERRRDGAPEVGLLQLGAMWLGGAAATSVVAGLATAPISAATFGRVSVWSLPANVLAAPILDFWVAPFSLLAAGLAPFDLDDWAWQAAAEGLSITLKIAHFIADLPGADARVAWTAHTLAFVGATSFDCRHSSWTGDLGFQPKADSVDRARRTGHSGNTCWRSSQPLSNLRRAI